MGEWPPGPDCGILPAEICDRLSKRAGIGSTGLIEILPSGDRVRKTVDPLETCHYARIFMRRQIQRDNEVYQRLGTHPRFIRMLGLDTDCDGEPGIILEYTPKGDLHEFLQSDVNISIERRLQWCLIDGKKPLSLENPRFFLPRDCREQSVVNVTTDLFALGSSFHEIVTRRSPYHPELKSDEVEARYTRQEFPQVEDVALGGIIRGCWMGDFTSAAAVLDAIELKILLKPEVE